MGFAQRAPNHFLNEDLDFVDEAAEELDFTDAMELMDPCEALLLEGRRTNPSSAYMSWVSREAVAVEGTKRLKDGVAEAVVGKKEFEREDAEYDIDAGSRMMMVLKISTQNEQLVKVLSVKIQVK